MGIFFQFVECVLVLNTISKLYADDLYVFSNQLVLFNFLIFSVLNVNTIKHLSWAFCKNLPLNRRYVFISGGKKCLFYRKLGEFYFVVAPVVRFALLPYYRLLQTNYFPKTLLLKCLSGLTTKVKRVRRFNKAR